MKRWLTLSVPAVLLGGASAFAQEVQEFPSSEIVVTAQKRAENIQDVPLAITALSASAMTQANVSDGTDLQRVVPSLNMTRGSGGTIIPFLRGVGNPSTGQGNEASVATYIDGVYYQRAAPIYFQFNNIERVEVLKGPQGTLFGRNAVGGVIHIVTRDPGDETVLQAEMGYGNFKTMDGRFYLGGRIAEGIAMDHGGLYHYQNDGWGKNVVTGRDYGFDRALSIRSKLVLEPTDNTSIKLIGDYLRSNSTIGIPALGYAGTTQGSQVPPFREYRPEDVGFYDIRANREPRVGGHSWGISGELRHDLGFADLVSISAYRRSRDELKIDNDYTERDIVFLDLPTVRKQFSQEFQLVSHPGSTFDWVVGLYHLDLDSKHVPAIFSGLAFGGAQRLIYGGQKVESNAGFGQATFHLGPNTNITGGLRYTEDKVSVDGRTDVLSPTNVLTTGTRIRLNSKFSKLTWKATLDHHLGEDVMVYASYSRGFKAGTYRMTPVTTDPVARPEVLDTYEIGAKTALFDRRLILNGSIFYNYIKDPQVTRFLNVGAGGSAVSYVNAGSADVKGIEVEGTAIVSRELRLNFGATVLEAKYRDFRGAPFVDPNPNPPYGNGSTYQGDASGNYSTRAPKLTFNAGFEYRVDTDVGEFGLTSNVYYNDGFYWDPDNFTRQKSFTLVDAGLEFKPAALDHLRVRVWGKNLTDKKYYIQEVEVAGPNGNPSSPGAPRTFGGSIALEF